jgi:hypothetical protein
MATLKSKGDNGSACFTPLVIGIFGVSPLASVKCVLASVYSSTTAPLKWLSTDESGLQLEAICYADDNGLTTH